MTLSERQCLHTRRMGMLIGYANSLGWNIKVSEWNRLLVTQKEYVAKGVSKTLDSKHLENCATDIYIIEAGAPTKDLEKYRTLGVYWEGFGGRWGGRFGLEGQPKEILAKKLGWDPYHMESADA